MATLEHLLVLVLTLLSCALLSSCTTVAVPANGNECFSADASEGEKVHIAVNVFAGGFLDINIKEFGPDDRVVFEEERVTSESWEHVAQMTGKYRICFSNTMSTVTAKHLSFTISVGNALQSRDVAKAEHLTPLENAIVSLSQALRGVSDEQKYMKVRERIAHTTNHSTNRRVLWWSICEALVLVGISVAKIYMLRTFFESKHHM